MSEYLVHLNITAEHLTEEDVEKLVAALRLPDGTQIVCTYFEQI